MQDQTSHIYLLLGPEIGQKTQFIQKLYTQLLAKEPQIEQYKFYPYDNSLSEIITIISTPSLFQEKRFLHIANIEDFDSASLEKLITILPTMSQDVWVVLTSSQTQAAKIHKKLDSIVPAKNKQIFWEMFENRKQAWIQTFFKKEQITITREAVDRLLSLVENNTQDLNVACEALAGYFKEKASINVEDVEQFIVYNREENAYVLFDYILQGDVLSLCETLNSLALSAEGVGVQTLLRLVWQWRKVLRLQELLQDGVAFEAATKQLSILGKQQIELYKKAVQRFSLTRLQEILLQCTKCDTLLRLNYPKNMQKTILETFLVSMSQNACCCFL